MYLIIKLVISPIDSPYLSANFLAKNAEYGEGKFAKMSIWDIDFDTQRFKFLRKNFFEGAEGALIFFDLTRRETYEEAKKIYTEMKKTIGSVPFILIGDNLDTINSTESTLRNEARKFTTNERGVYLEMTPDRGDLLEKAICELTSDIIDARGDID